MLIFFCVVIKGLKNVNAQFGQNSLTFRAVKQIIDTWKVTK